MSTESKRLSIIVAVTAVVVAMVVLAITMPFRGFGTFDRFRLVVGEHHKPNTYLFDAHEGKLWFLLHSERGDAPVWVPVRHISDKELERMPASSQPFGGH